MINLAALEALLRKNGSGSPAVSKAFQYYARHFSEADQNVTTIFRRLKEFRRKMRAERLSAYTRRNYILAVQRAWQVLPEVREKFTVDEQEQIAGRLSRMAKRIIKCCNNKQAATHSAQAVSAAGGGIALPVQNSPKEALKDRLRKIRDELESLIASIVA
jgi:hypothetical protein